MPNTHHPIDKDKVGGKSVERREAASKAKSQRLSEAKKQNRLKNEAAAAEKKKKK